MNNCLYWLLCFAVGLVFWAGFACSIAFSADIPQGAERTPRIEFMCDGLPDVVFNHDGSLDANGKTFNLAASEANKLFFTEGVIIEGVVEGDALYFDRSFITINNKTFECVAV